MAARCSTYNVEAQIGGKLAQLGQRLINSAAKKMADDFFVKFASRGGRGADRRRARALWIACQDP